MDTTVELTVDVNLFGSAAQKFSDDFWSAARKALREEAEIEMTEAKRRTPVDTGALRSSGTVVGPIFEGGDQIAVKLSFGGPSAPYALIVHEDTDAFHANGEALFLESTLRESAPYMAERVAKRIRQHMAR